MNQKINLNQIKELLLNPEISEKEVINNISEISAKFTKNRANIQDYVENENLVSSYALFYLPTNIPKFEFVFNKLEESIQKQILNNPFIDMGCGPGTYSYALSSFDHKEKIILVDKSKLMLKQAEKILSNTFKNNEFEFHHKLSTKMENATLFFGNSINEMGIQKAIDLVNIVSPEIVMFIEPGTSELFLELKQFRNWMMSDYQVLYPCPSNEACPNQWCHQVLRLTHSEDVERLSQLVGLDRRTMPMNAQVYIRKNTYVHKSENVVQMTLIQFINETKFSFIYEACEFHEGKNQNIKIEFLKKNLSKEKVKYFKNISLGEKIKFTKEKLVGDTWRGHVEE